MRSSSRCHIPMIGLLFLFLFLPQNTAGQSEAPCTGIMGAFGQEVSQLEESLQDSKIQSLLGVRFVTGMLKGRRVVVASSGVGKVNAAMTATLMIDHFKPREILFSGIAGAISPDLFPGDIVVAEKTAQHDLGTLTPDGIELRGMNSPVDWDRNPVFFEADTRLVALAETSAKHIELDKIRVGNEERSPRVVKGTVVTGDVFVASPAKKQELRKSLKADAVEMEGAAVAQVCRQFGVPCLVIRSISDSADAKARQDAGKFLEVTVRNSTRLVTEMVCGLASSTGR